MLTASELLLALATIALLCVLGALLVMRLRWPLRRALAERAARRARFDAVRARLAARRRN